MRMRLLQLLAGAGVSGVVVGRYIFAGKDDPNSRLPTAGGEDRASQLRRFGCPTQNIIRFYRDFAISYDGRTKTPNWVLEHLTPGSLDPNRHSPGRARYRFRKDPSIHPNLQSTEEDYRHSGYDRGHMAAHANHLVSPAAPQETFLLTNISPQVGKGFNQGVWSDLEQHVRDVTRKSKNVHVCTGPLYLPSKESDEKFYVKYEVIGPNHVAVPTHFFKVVLIENDNDNFEMESYVLPNKELPSGKSSKEHLKKYLTDLSCIEKAAGFLIFDQRPEAASKDTPRRQIS